MSVFIDLGERMKKYNLLILFTFFFIIALEPWSLITGMADEDHEISEYFEREDQHGIPFLETDNIGNETAGQIAALLLLAANLPVALSLLIKGANRFIQLGEVFKTNLAKFNRKQKKSLMWLHYYLNLIVFGIVFWHWLASRCKSSALPEIGSALMVTLILSGFLIKFKLCPKVFRKITYQIHVAPIIFISMFLILTVGHLIVD